MVNLLYHWFWFPFGTRFRITLRVLSGYQGTVFHIPLRRLSGFQVILGFVFPEHTFPVPILWSFEFSVSFFVGFKYLGHIFLWYHIGWYFVK